ncbi:hypothetical protein IEN85_18985 [Pelagicoccus sp. NFK12]|uniref:Uncharacterized protein n=1 Tax=Pelagicoccus enzymogenes TaxID=2773457 RepID=A0A927FDB3_9BACT|nr:hypothetical protein [Pelagicoccus enzymogenes]MBD5781595.1 hypothetical protein [Pelagicoccus enzymogenes]MDQ8200064.1 hypothetical protein [Pelagicoccus enzymogenes]
MTNHNDREPNFIERRRAEPNFIEKKRQWKSKMEKPLSRRTLMMVLPTLVLSVFVMMSAPYLKLIMEQFMKDGDDMSFPMALNLEEEKKVEKEGPPPDPEALEREAYRKKLEAEGFDWRKKPEIEGPDLSFAKEQDLQVKPLDVELPNTMTELRAASRPSETPSD